MASTQTVRETPSESSFQKLRNWFNQFDRFTKTSLIAMLLILMTVPVIIAQETNRFSRAANGKSSEAPVSSFSPTPTRMPTPTINPSSATSSAEPSPKNFKEVLKKSNYPNP